MRISDYIPTGKRNAVTLDKLKADTGKTAREIAKLIREERISGTVILTSSKGGYWLLDKNEDDAAEQLSRFISFMDSKNTFLTVKFAKEALKAIENTPQIHIDGV